MLTVFENADVARLLQHIHYLLVDGMVRSFLRSLYHIEVLFS